MGETVKTKEKMTGALPGFIISIVIGFAFYFGLKALSGNNAVFDYNNMISGILDSVPKQIAWFFMNFTEAQFYASIFAGIGIILGGIVAWILAIKNSKYAGFDVCYGSSTLFPWVLASQLISLGLAIFVFRYIPVIAIVDTFATTPGSFHGVTIAFPIHIAVGAQIKPPIMEDVNYGNYCMYGL